MNSAKIFSLTSQFLVIAAGSAVYAFGIHYFIIPNELMDGGVTGIALLLNYSLHLSPSYTSLLLNIPLFYAGWRMLGRNMLFTIVGTVAVSFFLWIMENLIQRGLIIPFRSPSDMFLATLYAGITTGLGLGLVFRAGGTTGGSDIIARIGNQRIGWSMGQVMLIFDASVIGLALFYIPKEKVLYTLVMVFIASRVIDFIQEGAFAAKAFTVISEQGESIAELITKELDHGVTLFAAKGAYSKTAKQVIYCVVYRNETRKFKFLVRSVDPSAFMIVSDVHDVLGEGFRPE